MFSPGRSASVRRELPDGATTVELAGVNHAQFGNYGDQPGDNPSAVADGPGARPRG